MGSHWAIAIGINQYESFQPLMYAQRDALVLHQFWSTEGAFPAHQCILFTDLSPAVEAASVLPTRDNILNVITQLCQQKLGPEDVLILFFSGYGVHFDGKDYLMTVESDPEQLPFTGIEVEFLLTKLKSAPTQQIVLMLDMSHSQSTLAGAQVGEQTLQLSNRVGITTFLSCQPDQFSHETLALRQGLYTAGILEALRYGGCVTPEQLATYLANRLPQLCEHYWRPEQNPVAFIPPAMRYALLLPGKSVPDDAVAQSLVQGVVSGSEQAIAPEASMPLAEVTLPQVPSQPAVTEPLAAAGQTDGATQDFWRRLATWGIPLALILCAGVLLTHWDELTGRSSTSAPSGVTPGASPSPLETGAPLPSQTSGSASPAPQETVVPVSPLPPALEGVQTALKDYRYTDALTLLEQVPADQRDDAYQTLLAQTAQGVLREARAATSRPRALSEVNQASDFNVGIQIARRLRPEHPLYPEAQRDIRNWSQGILDLAMGRANQPNQGDIVVASQNYRSGILAAQLVPPDQTEIYANAQREIAAWSRGIFDLANVAARDGNLPLAIATAQLLPPKTPDYEAAQQAIATWQPQVEN